MPVSFVDLAPKRHTATVTVASDRGDEVFEIEGLTLTQLAEIAKRFPAFLRVVEGHAPLLSASDALTAIIAAGLGHGGDAAYEQAAARLPGGVAINLAGEIMRLTFPPAADPLPNGADVEAGAAPAPTLPPPSSSS